MKKISFFVTIGLVLFAACSDSGNGGGSLSLAGGVETFDDLPACSKNREGDTAVVAEDSLTYVCLNGKWDVRKHMVDTVKAEDDLPACSKDLEGDSAYVSGEFAVYVCNDDTWEKTGSVMKTYGSLDNMPNCTRRMAGVDAISTVDSAVFLCDGERWKEMARTYGSDDDLPNCTEKREGSQAYLMETEERFLCSGKKWTAIEAWVEDSGESAPVSSSGKSSGHDEENESSSSTDAEESSSSMNEELFSSSSVTEEVSSSSEGNLCGSKEFDPELQFCDTRDSSLYKYVAIVSQTWMAEDLNYYDQSLLGKSWCYDNNTEYCGVYGRLYTWYAAVQGVCPDGWHVPTQSEWETLIDAVGGQDNAGKVLKSQTGWYSNGSGTDAYGFSALPAGLRYDNTGFFEQTGSRAYFWSATESEGLGDFMYLDHNGDDANLDHTGKYLGLSIRCLQD